LDGIFPAGGWAFFGCCMPDFGLRENFWRLAAKDMNKTKLLLCASKCRGRGVSGAYATFPYYSDHCDRP
jgi:hypothetical protein